MSEQHTLYRFKDKRDRLLYVGITNNPSVRMDQHRSDKAWWGEVATVSMQHYASREELAQAEREAIRSERPYWNRVHDTSSLDDHLGFYFGALPLAFGRLTIEIPHDTSRTLIWQIDRILSRHPGVIPVDLSVVHEGCLRETYVTTRSTSTHAVGELAQILGHLSVNLR